jgi:hypothetical protein
MTITHVKTHEDENWEYGETYENNTFISKWCRIKEFPIFKSVDIKNITPYSYCTKPNCHPTRVTCIPGCDWRS